MRERLSIICLLIALASLQASAQSLLNRVNDLLTKRYYKGGLDTAYIVRPQTKWTVTARLNVSGATIRAEGMDNGKHFKTQIDASRKATLSVGASYLGFSLNLSLNPAKLIGKYRDYELNFNSYGRRFGFNIVYQNAKNFKGWYDYEGLDRLTLPDGVMMMQALSVNAHYVFNSRRFSYPAAFSQSYIQRRSAGSFLVGVSGQWQNVKVDWDAEMKLKTSKFGIGAGYGYNFVPGRGWLLHISALPTLIVHSTASLNHEGAYTRLHYHFPEAIITGRTSVVHQWSNKLVGMSMVYTYTGIGDKNELAVENAKWYARAFFGLRF